MSFNRVQALAPFIASFGMNSTKASFSPIYNNEGYHNWPQRDVGVKCFKLWEFLFYELEMIVGGAKSFKDIKILTLVDMLP